MTVKEQASPMIKPPSNRFDDKKSAFEYARVHGGRVYRRTYVNPNTGEQQVSYVVKKDQGVTEVSRDTLKSYQQKVSADAMKHSADPTKRSPEKASRSVAGFAKAQKRLERGVAEGWKEEAQDLEDWAKEVNMRLYRAHESQRPGLARQLSKIEQQHFGSTLNQGSLTEIVHSALMALQKGDMVHYDPQRVGQTAFGTMAGDDARIIAASNMSRDEVYAFRLLRDKGIVDNIQQFLKLRREVHSKYWPAEYLDRFEDAPEELWLQFVKDLNWSKDAMNEAVQAKTDDKLLAYYAQRKAEAEKKKKDQNMAAVSINELAPGASGGDDDDKYTPPDFGKPFKAKYLGQNKFEVFCRPPGNSDPSKVIKLNAEVQKYGLEWDDENVRADGTSHWFLDSPGAVYLSWKYGEIPLPKAIDQASNPGHIHDLVTDYLTHSHGYEIQQVAKYFGFTPDGEMNEGMAGGSLKEFAPPGSDGGGENDRSRRIRKLLEIAIEVAKEKNVDELGMIHAMNMIAGDEFFNTAVEGLLPDITDQEYMFVLQTAYKTVKQGLGENTNFQPMTQADYEQRAEELHDLMMRASARGDDAHWMELKKQREELDAQARRGLIAENTDPRFTNLLNHIKELEPRIFSRYGTEAVVHAVNTTLERFAIDNLDNLSRLVLRRLQRGPA